MFRVVLLTFFTLLTRLALLGLLLYVVVALLALLIVAYKIAKPHWHLPNPGKSHTAHHLPPSWAGATTPEQLALPYTYVSFPSYANLTLRAWLIPSRLAPAFTPHQAVPSRVAVACVHGAGRDRRAFLRHAAFLSAAGFDTLLFDCANHGTSDGLPPWPRSPWPGRAITLGRREHLDVRAAVRYLRARGARRVVVLGTSQGAASAIVSAAQHGGVDALVLENAFVSPQALVTGVVESVCALMPVRLFPSAWAAAVVWLALWRTGNVPRRQQRRAEDYVGSVHVPMFFVHGTRDVIVSSDQSRRLFEGVAHERKELWLVEGAAHTQCWFTQPKLFEAKVLAFLARYLDTPS